MFNILHNNTNMSYLNKSNSERAGLSKLKKKISSGAITVKQENTALQGDDVT
jgi:translation initiation factor 1 (eIF-1/SUI1)